MKNKWIWTGSCFGVMFLFVLSNLGEDRDPQGNSTNNSDFSSNQSAAPISITAERLIAEYEANEVAADEKYKGKMMEVTETIKEIGKDFLNNMYVTLENGEKFSFRSVECTFGESLRKEAASLSKGRRITIRGQCKGMIADIQIKNCKFVNREPVVIRERENIKPVAVSDRNPTGNSTNNDSIGSNRSAVPIIITAERLMADYKANEIAADEKYKGKILEVTGIIKEIGKDIFEDNMFVALESGGKLEIRSVQCFLEENLRKKAASLSKGHRITLRGRCEGMIADIKIKNCEFVDQ